MSSGECAVWYRMTGDGEINPVVYANEGHAAAEAAECGCSGCRSPDLSYRTVIGVQFSDGRVVRKEDWPAYAEAVRFLEVQHHRPGTGCPYPPGHPLPEVNFTCPFTGERLRRYGAQPWLGVSQERLEPGAFTAYVMAKQVTGEPDFGLRSITTEQLREALGEIPAGDDGHAWLASVLSRRSAV